MSMVVQHNLTAMNSNRMLGVTTSAQAKSSEKLSSGYKINRAADDAAGLTISEKMRKQMKGLTRASTNAQDGVSAVQTAEGALTEVHSMLQRMNELATQAANGTNSEADRDAIQAEIDQLTTEIDRVSETTKFNETYLLKGEEAGTTVEKKLNAHDAGLDGKLVDNGSTATFTKVLEDGDTIKIAGEEYTIGAGSGKSGATGSVLDPKEMNTDKTAYVDLATAADFTDVVLGAGDSFSVDGTEYTVTDKISLDDITFAAADTFKVGEHYYSIVADTATPTTPAPGNKDGSSAAQAQEIKLSDAKKAIEEALANGDQVFATKFAGKKEDGTASASLTTATQVVAEYGKNEVSSVGATDLKIATLAQKANGGTAATFKEGDTYTKGGEKKIAVTKPETAKALYDSISALAKDGTKTVTIGTGTDAKTWTIIADGDEEDADSYKVHMDTVLSMIHDGDVVNYTGAANAVTVIGDIGEKTEDTAKPKTISAAEAYEKMAEELQKASSIGADEDKQATVASDGKGGFTITKGSTTVKEELFFNLHVGADADMTNKIGVTIEAMSAANLGVKDLDVIGKDENGRNINDGGVAATYAIDAIADAISKVSAQRSALGAVQNRLDHTIANLDNVVENTTAAESRIRDTDMATEMVEYSKNNILAQAGQSMLAQANQSNQGVLSLLQ